MRFLPLHYRTDGQTMLLFADFKRTVSFACWWRGHSVNIWNGRVRFSKKDMQHWRALMRAKLESGASFSFVWLTILIILLIPIFALKFVLYNDQDHSKKQFKTKFQYFTEINFCTLLLCWKLLLKKCSFTMQQA